MVVRELIRGAATDIDGNYIIERVPAGTYTLEASFVGYRTETRRVTVEEGATITVDFALFQTALNLQEVVVTGAGGPVEVKRLGNTIATINAARLEIAPVQNLSEMLMAREPSVAVLPRVVSPVRVPAFVFAARPRFPRAMSQSFTSTGSELIATEDSEVAS
ncbi:carboxypeptidase-like regulatory domain-containing protein [Rhodothermus marinus]|uniref:carboxypeptidase-like regulatory domain-containing protein n=1 Tax=Rhodothermus marinus TaxID=29549 RepID=UPI0006D07F2C|nr:carboxypeptidase-like regulatory domain-containing protein [Rhodothermus marinus]